jgi:hypothetical protein
MTPRMRRLVDGPVADRVRGLAIEHPDWTAAQVHRDVVEWAGGKPVVSLRTVQRFLKDFTRPDDSGPWTIETGESEDWPLVLPIVRMLIELAGTPHPVWPRRPTNAVADWIGRIRRAYPDLEEPGTVYYLATLAARGHADRVETFLSFTPWRDDSAALLAAFDAGLLEASALVYTAAALEMTQATRQRLAMNLEAMRNER